MPSITTENYLKAIFQLREKNPEQELVILGDLARELDLTPGTITTMIRSLADRGLVEYHRRNGVRLTETGRQQALNVVRRHRLIELFLVNVLNIDWAEVHEDAEALEHAVSERVLDRIDAMMGYPVQDPHGDPIPSKNSELPKTALLQLDQIPPDHEYVVSRIENQQAAFLDQVAQLGLKPGTRIRSIPEVEDRFWISSSEETVQIQKDIAGLIRVKAVS